MFRRNLVPIWLFVVAIKGIGIGVIPLSIGCGSDEGERRDYFSEFEVLITGESYSVKTSVGTSSWGYGEDGMGPTADSQSHPGWPEDNPALYLTARFRGFNKDDGIASGTTIDLSRASSADTVMVIFIVEEPESNIVGGDEELYAYYSSVTDNFWGGVWVPGSSGIVYIEEFGPGTSSSGYRVNVRLENVVLQKTESNEEIGQEIWPDQVSIPSARFCNLLGNCQ